jgi:hypothetical protein
MPKFTLADFRKDLSPKYKLVPLIDKAIAGFDEEWTFTYEPKEHDLYWHPSGHCVPVASALYDLALDRLNDVHDEDFQKSMRKYGPVGHFWHQFLQHIMVRYDMCSKDAIERKGWRAWGEGRASGVWPDMEWEAPKPYHGCVGSADVAPWNYKNHDYIVDFKTMGSRSFQQITLPNSFVEKYTCQMNIYMDFFGYDRALIVAINKDTPHDFKEFEFRRNDELIEAIYNKWTFVAEMLGDKERPDQDDDEHFALPEIL